MSRIKKIGILSMIVVIALLIIQYYFGTSEKIKSIYLVPEDAVFIIETEKPVEVWKKVSSSELWRDVRQNKTLGELTEAAVYLDTLLIENKVVSTFLSKKTVYTSIHMVKERNYGLLYIVDLDKIGKYAALKELFAPFIGDDMVWTERDFNGVEIIELKDKNSGSTLNLSLINNQLLASYESDLVENSIKQYLNPVIGRDEAFQEIYSKAYNSDAANFYIQHSFLDNFWKYISLESNPMINFMSKEFLFTGFDIEVKEKGSLVDLKGYSRTSNSLLSFIDIFESASPGDNTADKVIPENANVYMNFSVEKFELMYSKLEEYYKDKNNDDFGFFGYIEEAEKKLKLDFKNEVVEWLGGEIGLASWVNQEYGEENTVLIFDSKNSDEMLEGLEKLKSNLKDSTPLKFKELEYEGFKINYLTLSGIVKLIFGRMFEKIEKPNYTVIDGFLILSNSPTALRGLIDFYKEDKTLAENNDYQKIINSLDDKTQLFVYTNPGRIVVNRKYQNLLVPNDIIKDYGDVMENLKGFALSLSVRENRFQINAIANHDPNFNELLRSEMSGASNYPVSSEEDDRIDRSQKDITIVDEDSYFEIDEIIIKNYSSSNFEEFFTNGEVKRKVGLKEGKPHGMYREYYPNGELKLKGRFKNGIFSGSWRAYSSLGKMIKKKSF